jgi:hypothetical protein
MAVTLDPETRDLLADPATTGIIATVDEEGIPQVTVSRFLRADGDHLIHLELLESSPTTRDLLRSLWFDRKVAVLLKGEGGESRVIRGRAIRTHISGPVFRSCYETVRGLLGDAGLAGVWVIEADEIIDDTYETRRVLEKERFPFHLHLDQLAVPDP